MAEKSNWLCICKKGESNIFTVIKQRRPGKIKQVLSLVLVLVSSTLLLAQTFSRHKIMFTLSDKSGTQLTGAAISTGKVRVYTLREAKTITHSHLSFDKKSKYFTFGESAISPGMLLAFVSATDTMYVSFFGRSSNRILDGIKVQQGSYVLTSNEFAGQKVLQVDNWNKYLEEGTPVPQQDLSMYRVLFKDKQPLALVDRQH
jgi:hypothetical protein